MSQITPEIVKEFCELCNWTYECWITHKKLFDKNSRTQTTIARIKYFSDRLSRITQEYVLLQICKLHDPPQQKGMTNLTIEYIAQYGEWGEDTELINSQVQELRSLYDQLRPARHKLLAHNDLETIMKRQNLGSFQKGLDEKYFAMLQELVSAIHVRFFNTSYMFNEFADMDVEEFLDLLTMAKSPH